MKRIIVYGFLIIILLPSVLKLISIGWNLAVDVPLSGYTDTVEEPILSYDSFSSGEYQLQYTNWFESKLKPRGAIIKSYATIRYNIFNLGNRIIGKNKDVFEYGYISAEYTLTPTSDMSVPESKKAMDDYLKCLEEIQKKLMRFDKSLYFYVAANKAKFDKENVPQKYKNISSDNSVNIVDYLREELDTSTIPHQFCEDLKDKLIYPAYYPTGIHWSRTYEQIASQNIIADIADETGNNYRNLKLTNVNESKTPYWRDADVFGLLNVWNALDGTFYEYSVEQDDKDRYDKMRFLIWGDSYAEGLWHDITETYPNEDIYYINYSEYVKDPDGIITDIGEDWSKLDLQTYLDNTDVIIFGSTEHNLTNYSCGFAQYLNKYLDTYEPGQVDSIEKEITYENGFNNTNYLALHGIWPMEGENNYLWTESNS